MMSYLRSGLVTSEETLKVNKKTVEKYQDEKSQNATVGSSRTL